MSNPYKKFFGSDVMLGQMAGQEILFVKLPSLSGITLSDDVFPLTLEIRDNLTTMIEHNGLKLVRALGGVFAFEMPPQTRTIRFSNDRGATTTEYTVPMPTLVFIWNSLDPAINSSFRVMTRSTLDTDYRHLRALEIGNTYPDGHVCFGSHAPTNSIMQCVSVYLEAPFNPDLSVQDFFIKPEAWDQTIGGGNSTNPEERVRATTHQELFHRWAQVTELSDVSDYPIPSGGNPIDLLMLQLLTRHSYSGERIIQFNDHPYLLVNKKSVDAFLAASDASLGMRESTKVLAHIYQRKLYAFSVRLNKGQYEMSRPGNATFKMPNMKINANSMFYRAEAMKALYYYYGSEVATVETVRQEFQRTRETIQVRMNRNNNRQPNGYQEYQPDQDVERDWLFTMLMDRLKVRLASLKPRLKGRYKGKTFKVPYREPYGGSPKTIDFQVIEHLGNELYGVKLGGGEYVMSAVTLFFIFEICNLYKSEIFLPKSEQHLAQVGVAIGRLMSNGFNLRQIWGSAHTAVLYFSGEGTPLNSEQGYAFKEKTDTHVILEHPNETQIKFGSNYTYLCRPYLNTSDEFGHFAHVLWSQLENFSHELISIEREQEMVTERFRGLRRPGDTRGNENMRLFAKRDIPWHSHTIPAGSVLEFVRIDHEKGPSYIKVQVQVISMPGVEKSPLYKKPFLAKIHTTSPFVKLTTIGNLGERPKRLHQQMTIDNLTKTVGIYRLKVKEDKTKEVDQDTTDLRYAEAQLAWLTEFCHPDPTNAESGSTETRPADAEPELAVAS